MTTQSQKMLILDLLKKGGKINPRMAREKFGCERLASRISDIKDMGYTISRTMVTYVDEDGDERRYAEYELCKNE